MTPQPDERLGTERRAISSARRPSSKVAHVLASDLRRQILRGDFAVGERLAPESELTEHLQVSRETLREALRILESQSLVEVRRGRGGGPVVRRPGLDSVNRYVALLLQLRKTTLADLQEVRSIVEPVAAAEVAMRAGHDELDRLVALHDTERDADLDHLAFVAAVLEFDQAVTEFSGNQTLRVIAGVFRDIHAGQVYAAIRHADTDSAKRIARHVIAGHRAFLDAARRRDARLAQQAWGDYLLATRRMLIDRSRRRQPFDVTPLWRARASSDTAPHRALALATEIRARIADGGLREGDRLAPLDDLAAEFGMSRPTMREALRVLETEHLLTVRPGDRGGAVVQAPSTQMAAQLAGVVLEARQATLGDFSRALRMIEPPIMELIAARITRKQLAELLVLCAELGRSTQDTVRFVQAWHRFEAVAFTATRNPALTVIAEVLQWVRIGVESAVTAEANQLPWVEKTNRNTHALLSEFVDAAGDRDPGRARDIWAALLNTNAPFVEDSKLGERLVIDLID